MLGDLSMSLEEMASLLGEGTHICPDCGKVHPLPGWAIEKNECPTCKHLRTPYGSARGDNVDRIIAAESVDELFLKQLVENVDAYAGLEHNYEVDLVAKLGSDGVQVKIRPLVEGDGESFLASIAARGKFGNHNMVEVVVGDETENAVVVNAVPKMVLAILLEW